MRPQLAATGPPGTTEPGEGRAIPASTRPLVCGEGSAVLTSLVSQRAPGGTGASLWLVGLACGRTRGSTAIVMSNSPGNRALCRVTYDNRERRERLRSAAEVAVPSPASPPPSTVPGGPAPTEQGPGGPQRRPAKAPRSPHPQRPPTSRLGSPTGGSCLIVAVRGWSGCELVAAGQHRENERVRFRVANRSLSDAVSNPWSA